MFSLNYREFWASVSGWLAEELDQVVASAQAKWGRQHAVDGSHTSITADTVTTDRLTFRNTYTYVVPTTSNTNSSTPGVTLRLPSRTSALVLKKPLGAGVSFFGVHAIEVPDSQPGDLLAVVVQSSGIYLISSAFCQVPGGAIGPFFPIGDRISLSSANVANLATDGTNYFDTLTQRTGCLLMRVDAYDYDESPLGEQRYQCWVQIG